jgi:hypothetical protein
MTLALPCAGFQVLDYVVHALVFVHVEQVWLVIGNDN